MLVFVSMLVLVLMLPVMHDGVGGPQAQNAGTDAQPPVFVKDGLGHDRADGRQDITSIRSQLGIDFTILSVSGTAATGRFGAGLLVSRAAGVPLTALAESADETPARPGTKNVCIGQNSISNINVPSP